MGKKGRWLLGNLPYAGIMIANLAVATLLNKFLEISKFSELYDVEMRGRAPSFQPLALQLGESGASLFAWIPIIILGVFLVGVFLKGSRLAIALVSTGLLVVEGLLLFVF